MALVIKEKLKTEKHETIRHNGVAVYADFEFGMSSITGKNEDGMCYLYAVIEDFDYAKPKKDRNILITVNPAYLPQAFSEKLLKDFELFCHECVDYDTECKKEFEDCIYEVLKNVADSGLVPWREYVDSIRNYGTLSSDYCCRVLTQYVLRSAAVALFDGHFTQINKLSRLDSCLYPIAESAVIDYLYNYWDKQNITENYD